TVDAGLDEPNSLASSITMKADGQQPQAALAGRIDHLLRAIVIGGNDRRAAGRNEIAKQPQLGIEIMRDIGMIIHVVAREIGEAGRRDAHAIEAILIESVRGRLEGEMRDAVARDLVELAMQRDWIGRGQRAVDRALRRYQPDGADARRGVAKALPDLAREGRDRGLAAGAGDGGDGRGLSGKKFRRSQRQRAAWIGRGYERPCEALRRMLAGNGHGARRNRGIDEAYAVGFGSSEREEKVAGFHHAAIHGEARDVDGPGLLVDFDLVAEEVAKLHHLPVGRTRRKPCKAAARLRKERPFRLTALSSMPQE